MASNYAAKIVAEQRIWYRPNADGSISGDERIIAEVIESACYRRVRDGFDVERGETWLDLGANIGAFGVYCKSRGARAHCYEPEAECFKLLKKNVGAWAVNAAVTHLRDDCIAFYTSPRATHARGTILPVHGYGSHGTVPNRYAGYVAGVLGRVDGIKMDIEGSEFEILDKWLLPKSDKLVLEYHTSRDPSVENLERRIAAIQQRYKHVRYPPEFDRGLDSGATTFKAYFDRLIFAWN
jgi:FkbM family methyltransferase